MRLKTPAVFACALAVLGCRGPEGAPSAGPELRRIEIGFPDGKKISAEVAETPASRERGYMYRTKLGDDDGMLFIFAGEQELQFWMKNTFVDLDMAFIGADKRITVLHREVPRSLADTPEANVARRSGAGKYVLELPAGAARRHGLKAGDVLRFGD